MNDNIFEFLKGKYIVSNPDAAIFVDVPLHNQILYEDIIQISNINNSDNLCVDIGWYGDLDNGFFNILVIEDCDWEVPLYSMKTRSVEQLDVYLKEALKYINL